MLSLIGEGESPPEPVPQTSQKEKASIQQRFYSLHSPTFGRGL